MLSTGVRADTSGFARAKKALSETTVSTVERPVVGVDVSEEHGRIAWRKVADAGFTFAYVDATQGTSGEDRSFVRNASQAMEAGIPLGACHSFHPDEDPVRQAEHFLASAHFYLDPEPNWGVPGFLPPVLEIERFPSQAGTLTQRVQTWLDVVEQATGRLPLLYCGAGFWKIYLARAFAGLYPIWLAEYATAQMPPSGLRSWVLWQQAQSHEVPGIDGPVDVNRLAPGFSVNDLMLG